MEKVYILLILFLFLIILFMILSHIKINITNYKIKSSKIDKNLKIVFLSDLHNRKCVLKLAKIIKNINPDLIIYGGDMINESIKEIGNFIVLYKLLDKYDTYYVYGNHEEQMPIKDKLEYNKIVNNININILNNTKCKLSKNIVLYGLNSEVDCYKKFGEKGLNLNYINNKLGKIDTKKYNILISHNPLEFDSYVSYNADLVLSGHIHGGIINVPFIGGLLSPDVTFFPKYYSGLYKKNKTRMIVSRGIGYSKHIPFRLFNPAEIVVININKSS